MKNISQQGGRNNLTSTICYNKDKGYIYIYIYNKIHRRIKNVFQKVISGGGGGGGKIRIVHKTTHRLSHLFRFKDLVPSDISSVPVAIMDIAEKHVLLTPFSVKTSGGCVATAITKHIKERKV